jgi:hypothetical protein
MKLHVLAFALTCAVVWGFGIFLLTWWIIAFDGATGEKTFIGLVYRGYDISPLGSVYGLVWGLLDGFLAGIVFAWVYNVLRRKPVAEGEK